MIPFMVYSPKSPGVRSLSRRPPLGRQSVRRIIDGVKAFSTNGIMGADRRSHAGSLGPARLDIEELGVSGF